MNRRARSVRTASPEPDTYFELVREFPLRPIRTRATYRSAAAVLDALVLRDDLDPGETDYMESLALLVEDYDRRHILFDTRRRTPMDMLRHLMEANALKPADLAPLLGGRGRVSELLAGKRELSKGQIYKLAVRFKVEGGLFL
jgi:HTH-type transcriptional regulator/antitoxin HigA